MVHIVGGGEDFGLVDIVDANGFEDLNQGLSVLVIFVLTDGVRGGGSWLGSLSYLALNKVSNTSLGHDRDRHGFHDLLDHTRVRHARNTPVGSDISRHTLKSHDSGSTGLFRNTGLSNLSDPFLSSL